MAIIQNKPFSKLKFPIHEIPQGVDLVNEFKELQGYPEFANYSHKDRNNVIRYVFYCYDLNSDLIKQFTDLKKRKEAAAELAGFKRNEKDGKFHKDVYDMMEFKKKTVEIEVEEEEGKKAKTETEVESNKIYPMVMTFLKMQQSRLWSMIVTTEQAFEEYQGLIMEPVSESGDKDTLTAAKTKDALMDSCDKMNQRIDEYYNKLFGANDDLKEIKKKPIRPETIGRDV